MHPIFLRLHDGLHTLSFIELVEAWCNFLNYESLKMFFPLASLSATSCSTFFVFYLLFILFHPYEFLSLTHQCRTFRTLKLSPSFLVLTCSMAAPSGLQYQYMDCSSISDAIQVVDVGVDGFC